MKVVSKIKVDMEKDLQVWVSNGIMFMWEDEQMIFWCVLLWLWEYLVIYTGGPKMVTNVVKNLHI